MKKKKLFPFLLAIGILVGTVSMGGSNFSLIGQIKSSAFQEFEIFRDTNATDSNSTIEEKLNDEIEDFYESIEELFVLYSDSNSTYIEANATMYTLGDHEFYFGKTEEGYYFGDVNGTIYYIEDINGTLPDSADTHLNSLLPTFEKVLKALEDGKLGRAFGLLNSCEVRLRATDRYFSKVQERNQKKEERELKLQIKKETKKNIEKENKNKGKENKNRDNDKGNGKGKKKDKDKNKDKGKNKDKRKDKKNSGE